MDKTTVIKASSAGSSILPAIAIIGVGYLGYKALSGVNFGGIAGGIAGGISERITETVTDVKESISKTTNNIIEVTKEGGEAAKDTSLAAITSLNPLSTPKEPIDKYSKAVTQTGFFTANSGLMGAGIGLSVANVYRKKAIDKGLIENPNSSLNVSSINNSVEAFSAGLGNAPLAVNANPSNLGGSPPTKYKNAYAKAVAEGNVISWKNPDNKKKGEMGSGDNKISKFKSKYV